MPFKTPSFWYRESTSWKATMLSPISAIYGHITGSRIKKRPSYAANAKVICIGNLTAGGSGKTPLALALRQMINARNVTYLSRGYGGCIKDATLITQDHNAKDVGDEPMLLARRAPTIISADRVTGAKLAESHHSDVIIMDDGLQNPSLYKDLRIVVVDSLRGFGNMKCIPAGPLRQPLAIGLLQADCFVVIGEKNKQLEKILPKAIPIFYAEIIAAPPENISTTQDYLAFCGIAHPDKFLSSLKRCKINVKEFKGFADHHSYSKKELNVLDEYASAHNLRLITTEKDAVRISDGPWQKKLDILPITLKFKAEAKFKAFIDKALSVPL